ncbi:MAG: winged helix-turn-helix transcriptional regulator [Candidatus Brockarchaeota archaeon]|nr:winged helix-turn-helix transcriptional regulator [Candidatus Brockarchaeota archaeon]
MAVHHCDLDDPRQFERDLKKATDNYLEEFDFTKHAKIFNAIGEEKRLKMLMLLEIREMCNCELTAALGMTQPNLTYHVKKLENAGLLDSRKQGKYIYYAFKDRSLAEYVKKILS